MRALKHMIVDIYYFMAMTKRLIGKSEADNK